MKRTIFLKVVAITLVLGFLSVIGAMAEEEAISGTISKNDQGQIVLSSDDGEDYLVKGQDLSGMVGKSVSVVGTLEEEADGMTLTIVSFKEVQD